MNHTEVRVRELNLCAKLINAETKRLCGTKDGTLIYGMRNAIRVLMERKRFLRRIVPGVEKR